MQDGQEVEVVAGEHTYSIIPWLHGKLAVVSTDPHGKLKQPRARRRLRRELRNTGISVNCDWRRLNDGSNRILVAVFCWVARTNANPQKILKHIQTAFVASHPAPNPASTPALAT